MSYGINSERHVVVSCLFKKSSFKTAGIQAMLESAVEAVSEDTSTLEWVNNIRLGFLTLTATAIELKMVSKNNCKKSILDKNSPFFLHRRLG